MLISIKTKKNTMKTIQNISVTVKYTVSLGNIEDVPQEVYNELMEAFEDGYEINPMSPRNRYTEAGEWLAANIKESDCMEWECEIDDLD